MTFAPNRSPHLRWSGVPPGARSKAVIVVDPGVPSLGLSGAFGGPEALAAMEGHVLAESSWTGTYTLNPLLRQ